MYPIFINENGILTDNYGFALSAEDVREIAHCAKTHLKKFKDPDSLEFYNFKVRKEHDEWSKQNSIERDKKAKLDIGFIYLMQDSGLSGLKIGYSKKPEAREKTLRLEQPNIKILFSVRGTFAYERMLHTYFKEKRIRGEWFDITPDEVIKFIEENPFGNEEKQSSQLKVS